jgi:hypothetical protein
MRFAVTDANIFIDLIRIELIDQLFQIDCEIHSSFEVFEELNDYQQQVLQTYTTAGKLTLNLLDPEDLEKVDSQPFPKTLSYTDSTVIFLALKLEASVLTGDGPLRKFCDTKKIEVHGILWLFDKFIIRGLLAKEFAAEKLEALLLYNERLPKSECTKRLTEWRS